MFQWVLEILETCVVCLKLIAADADDEVSVVSSIDSVEDVEVDLPGLHCIALDRISILAWRPKAKLTMQQKNNNSNQNIQGVQRRWHNPSQSHLFSTSWVLCHPLKPLVIEQKQPWPSMTIYVTGSTLQQVIVWHGPLIGHQIQGETGETSSTWQVETVFSTCFNMMCATPKPPSAHRTNRRPFPSAHRQTSLVRLVQGWGRTVITGRARLGGHRLGLGCVRSSTRWKPEIGDHNWYTA